MVNGRLELIQQSLRDNPRDPGFGLFMLIVRQFRLLLMTRDHLDQGGGTQAARHCGGGRARIVTRRVSWRCRLGGFARSNWMRY